MGDVMHEMQQPGHATCRPAGRDARQQHGDAEGCPDPHGAALGAVIPGVLVRWSSITVLLITARVSASPAKHVSCQSARKKNPRSACKRDPFHFGLYEA